MSRCWGDWARTCPRSAKSFFPVFAGLRIALRVHRMRRHLAHARAREHASTPDKKTLWPSVASIFSLSPGITSNAPSEAPASAAASAYSVLLARLRSNVFLRRAARCPLARAQKSPPRSQVVCLEGMTVDTLDGYLRTRQVLTHWPWHRYWH